MTWSWTTLTVLLAAIVGLLVVLTIAVWQRRRYPGAWPLTVFLCAASLYTLAYLLDLNSPGLEAKLLWAKVRIVGTVLIAPASLALAFHAIGQSYRLTRPWLLALSIHPALTLALYWTEPAHQWIWQSSRLAAAGDYSVVQFTYGPAYWLHIFYTYLLSCFILAQTAGALLKMPNVSRGQTAALFFSVLSPVIGSALTTLRFNPFDPIRLEPFMFPVAAAGWSWAIFRYQLFGVVPIARDWVVETVEDAVIVLDARQRVGDLNRAARRLIGNTNPVGQLASQAFAHYPRLIPFLAQPIASPLTLTVDGAPRHYDLRTVAVYDQRERIRGWLTTLRDVTQRERAARIQSATYQISQAAAQTQNLPELYQSIHATLGTLMPAQNLFIALYDAAAGQLSFPYYVDEHDPPPPPQKLGRGLTEYVIRTCQTQWVHQEAFDRLVQAGEVEEIGAPSIDWLGAPLITQTRIIGVLAVQSYTPGVHFSEAERDILTFVSTQVSLAIERKQAEADLQIRDRMLAGVAEATADLLSPDPLPDTIQRALARLGNATGVDRAYIFENGRDPATRAAVMHQRYEWARLGIRPQIDNAELQNLPYARFPNWWEQLGAGQAISSLVKDLPPDLQELMTSQGILSLLLVPILIEKRFWGFIGLDDCHSLRLWSASEIALLVTVAANFGTAIRRRQTELMLQNNERSLGLLNAMTQSALQTPHPTTMFGTLARQMTELFNARGCYIGLWEEAPPRLLSVAAFGPQAEDFLALQPEPEYTRFAAQVLEQRQPIVTADLPAPGAPVIPTYLEELFHEWDFVLLPLVADEARLGIIALAFDSPHAFTPDELAHGTQAAGQVALTLAKVRALELAERRAREAETLRQAGAAVAATLDQDEAVERILEQLARVVPYDTASVQLLRDEALEVVGGRGWPDLNTVRGLRFPVPGDNASTQVVQQRQPVLIADVWEAAPYFRDHPSTQHVRAWLGVPLIIQQRLIGIISLDSRQPGYFTADHARLSSAFADQVAVAIENARLYQSAQQNASEAATLYRASEQLFGSSQDVTELTHRIVQAVAREFPEMYCGLRLLDESENYLGGLAEAGALLSVAHPRPAIELNEPGLIPLAVRTGEAIYVPDVRIEPRYVFSHADTRSELVVPLLVKNHVIGVLNLESPQVHGFDDRARRLIVAFAERAALALENAQLLARLEVARQAAQEASRLKGEFLTNTSHELRTPLTGILGSLDLVIEGMCQSPEEEREFLRIARQAGRQLLSMINMLLDLSRIESGKIEVKAQTVDVSPLMIEVYLLMQPQAQERSLQLELKLPPEPHSRIWADPDKVRQIMLNLIGNALKFTVRGQVLISAEPDQVEGLMRLNVQDTGIGIPQEQQGRLFQPFVQLDGSSTRKFGGTGLGLNISRRLAQMMDGSLTLYSAGADQGSTFTLTLPLAQER